MKLGELVDHMFPPILYSNVRTAEISRAEYNDFNYWKVPLANLNLNSEALEGVVLPHEINKKAKTFLAARITPANTLSPISNKRFSRR